MAKSTRQPHPTEAIGITRTLNKENRAMDTYHNVIHGQYKDRIRCPHRTVGAILKVAKGEKKHIHPGETKVINRTNTAALSDF